MTHRNLTLANVQKLASELAKKYKTKGVAIGLVGNLGSGKTTFAKSFAKAMGIKNLKSPTFIVSQRYSLAKNHLYHLDFYRLEEDKQLIPLGLAEILSGDNIVLIEWVDKFPQIAKQCDLVISFQVKPHDKRDIQIKYN